MKIGCYGVSCDPITNGHIAIAKEALRIIDKLIIGIGLNPQKKGTYMFSIEERVYLVKEALKEYRDRIEVYPVGSEFLVNFAIKHNCSILIRGLRNEVDFQSEVALNNLNKELSSDLSTIYLMADKVHLEISSSLVKSLLLYKDFEQMLRNKVPARVYEYLIREKILWMVQDVFCDHNLRLDLLRSQLGCYLDEGRFYHNISHIYQMLKSIDSLIVGEDVKKELYLATIYHDIVYNPQKIKGENELESRSYFEKKCFVDLDPSLKNTIGLYIESTIKHEPLVDNSTNKIFLDLDLSILASPSYKKYATDIRREYSFVPEDVYIKERTKVLKKFIKKQIYYSQEFLSLEGAAKENLKWEVNSLSPKK